VVEDPTPVGALELALAEQIAAKLWRLGRVVLFEANFIDNAQDPEELAHWHEKANPSRYGGPARTDIPTRADVVSARKAIESASKKAQDLTELVRQMEALPTMADEDAMPNWDVYTALEKALDYTEKELERIFKNLGDEDPFTAGKLRAMLALKGDPAEGIEIVANSWRTQRADAEKAIRKNERTYKSLARRYKAAVERLRRTRAPKRIRGSQDSTLRSPLGARTSQGPRPPPVPPGSPRGEPPDNQTGRRSGGLTRASNGFDRQFCHRGGIGGRFAGTLSQGVAGDPAHIFRCQFWPSTF
jgi:hypothetical protein